MHKQDTARLNAPALAERFRTLGLKQYLVARQIGVEPLTVNRWLTGKVRRISRDNLTRLASVLQCDAAEISHADEADVRATQVEQARAAQLLVETRARQMFELSTDYELYDSLLKAVMHPNMPVAELCEVYNALTKTALRLRREADAREYCRLTLEYAQRCGNTDREFSARVNLAAIDGEAGQLARARTQLEEVRSFAESVGHLRGRAITGANLVHACWLQADWHAAIRVANESVPLLRELEHHDGWHGVLSNAAFVARDTGQYALAAQLWDAAETHPTLIISARARTVMDLIAAQLCSLAGDPPGALAQLTPIYNAAVELGRMIEDYCTSAAVVFRRAGELQRAQEHVDAMLAADWLGPYDPPFLLAESARIAAARGDGRSARRLRQQANAQFAALGMERWATDDPGVELGQQFKAPPRLKLKVL